MIILYNYCNVILCLAFIPMMAYLASRGNCYDFINLFLKKFNKNKNCKNAIRKQSSSKIQPEISSVDYSSLIVYF